MLIPLLTLGISLVKVLVWPLLVFFCLLYWKREIGQILQTLNKVVGRINRAEITQRSVVVTISESVKDLPSGPKEIELGAPSRERGGPRRLT